jgi:hypothetical protein
VIPERSLLIVLERRPGRLQHACGSAALCNCKGLRRPIDHNLVVDVSEDHVIGGWRLHIVWWTDPSRKRRVNRRRQHEEFLWGFWRREVDEFRGNRWQKGCWNSRRRRKVVGGVAKKDYPMLDVDPFLGWRWRNVVVDGTELWRRFQRSVQKRKPAMAIACVGTIGVEPQVRPIRCWRIEPARAPPDQGLSSCGDNGPHPIREGISRITVKKLQ